VGNATWTLSLSPKANDSATVYNVAVSFAGDKASTATATMTTINGTTYDVCTTTQYNTYEPSSNSTSITVTSQTTIGATTLMNMEQMQKNAEAPGGGLSVYPEFSWWYPWFRLHFAWKYNGQTMLDVGIAILPGADTANFPDTTFKGKINEWFFNIATSVFVGLIATEVALWAGSNLGLLYFGVILGFYYGYKFAGLYLDWDSLGSLYTSLASNLVSTAYAAWTGLCSFLPSSLQALAAGAESIKNVAFAFLCKLITIPINLVLLMLAWNQIVKLGGV
jgi:hypothetical protein